ncbi:MAG: hypothetical protein IPK70_07845 [Flavobacteriales bacterium]|jgi:hypothetical protein|nr:hypothetical protein [Flavobacteriales bacterium]
MTRTSGIVCAFLLPVLALGQGGDQQVRAKADQLFQEQRFAEAMPLYSQLVSLTPSDRTLNYRFGACLLHGSADKEQAIGHLKFATDAPTTDPLAWYWLGRAYHLNYRFKEAQTAYQRFLGTADKKLLAAYPVEALQKQCRNGEKLLSNLKEITVRSKVEVADADFFRFYDLADIGGRLVVLPEELKTSLDKKRKHRSLVHLPERNGPIYFSSYGKDGATGLDIYRSELLPDGTYAAAVKLAGYINTEQDEDFPFMHPSGKTFYFSGKGHNSMGGYDVFRAGYDKGLDAFGRPENLDFAVSTPDDDILYIVDAEQKEACFASGRNSKQGMLHVYRVGTAQAPVNITVFKGTYASSLDKEDRKASIVVEDMLTQEQVAVVRTDINGNYALSLPRAGRYRYRVDCGPSGKTHTGVVDVPKAEGPRAYRQELILDRNGDLERLTIRNYFDDPLGEDMVALALDEIKRRARLDVSTREVVAEVPKPVEQPTGDLLTRAGFTGDIDQARALQLASDDAREREAQSLEEQAMAGEAFAIALDATQEAEKAALKADDLVKRASAITDDEQQRNALMTEAAIERQRAREAAMRARAAQSTGVALSTAALNSRQRAAEADKLSSDLKGAITAKDDEKALAHLRTLKLRLDERAKPELAQEPAEQARRNVQEQEKEAARLLAMAKAKRDEESELADGLARLKRERIESRARSKQEELDRRIAELEQQQQALRDETQAAVRRAEIAERQTAVVRGQASLTRHLTQTTERGAGSELTAAQSEQLGMRISSTDQRVAALPIDERFDAAAMAQRSEAETRAFDWDLASAAQAIGEQRDSTRTAERNADRNERLEAARNAELPASAAGDKNVRSTTAAQAPQTSGTEDRGLPEDAQRVANRSTTQPSTGTTDRTVQSATIAQVTRTSGTEERLATEAQEAGEAELEQSQGLNGVAPDGASDQRFVLENERAELQQLAGAERDRAKREQIQQRITAIEESLARLDAQAGTPEAEPEVPADMSVPALGFNSAARDETIIADLYKEYASDLQRAERLVDLDARADAINGIESMLADSLRAEMQRQVAVLNMAPQQAEAVLPRVDRLRRMREEHLARGEQAIAQRQAELAGGGGQASDVIAEAETSHYSPGQDPIKDRYVAIDRYARDVFSSKVEHRSTAKGMSDAIAFRDADVARMDDLSTRIDSMEKQLAGMPLGKESDKLRKKTDQLIDERYIIRTDLGQRSAFLMREEWKSTADSLKRVEALTAKRGLAPDEPLLGMAREFASEANGLNDRAAQLRKRADRSEDIVLRDSLYRRAYRDELLALQAADKAITVQNYLAGEKHSRGEKISYEEVAARVLGIQPAPAEPMLTQQATKPSQEAAAPSSEAAASETGEHPALSAAEPPARIGDREVSLEGIAVAPSLESKDALSDRASTGEVQQAGSGALADSVSRKAGTGPVNSIAPSSGASQAIAQAERRLTDKDKVPARLYESFMKSETVTLNAATFDPESDPDLFVVRSESKARDAAELEQRSQEAADRAAALADSATTARKRDRDRLQALAVRERAISDSLHAASLRSATESADLSSMAEEAVKAKALRERLVKFYYLTAEEQRLVLLEGDASRYFQAKALAMEQSEAAMDAEGAAKSNREVADLLRQQARSAERDAVDGRITAAEASSRALLLDARAVQLELKADSLSNIASRLRGAAGINEAQAGVMLQALPEERSSELMAIEQRARRTEALLAESRGQAAAGRELTAQPGSAPQSATAQSSSSQPALPDRRADAASDAAANGGAQPAIPTTSPIAEALGEGGQPSPLQPSTFRMPDELVEDFFVLNEPTARREAAIPMDVDLPSGIVFKVQIGAFRKPIPQEAFSDMTPVMGETVGNGLVRYTAGLFTGAQGALAAKDLVRERGYRDAFVVAYRDGKRISLGEAMRATQQGAELAERPIRVRGGSEEPAARLVESPVPAAPPAIVIKQPVAGVQASEPADDAAILARYPASAQQIVESFVPSTEAAAYYNVPGAAPAKQVETIKGLFFTVQVGVYSRPVPLDKLFNITPLNSELTESAKVRYTTGRYMDLDAARIRKDEAVRLGVKDAFITAYLNGKRIPVREGSALLQQFGAAILAQP